MTSPLSFAAPAVVIASGAWIAASQFGWALRAFRSRSWPKAQGSIERAKVVPTGARIDRGHGSFEAHVASVAYRYMVGGQSYVGSLVSYKGYIPNVDRVEKIVARYPDGAEVQVAYDPINPEVAVLEPGLGVGNCLGVGFGVALLIGGALWLSGLLGAA